MVQGDIKYREQAFWEQYMFPTGTPDFETIFVYLLNNSGGNLVRYIFFKGHTWILYHF